MQTVLFIWVICCSIYTFMLMGFDKRRAQLKERRIPERDLWLAAILGGGIGAYVGMHFFRHKTKHTSFRIGFLIIAASYIVLMMYLYQQF